MTCGLVHRGEVVGVSGGCWWCCGFPTWGVRRWLLGFVGLAMEVAGCVFAVGGQGRGCGRGSHGGCRGVLAAVAVCGLLVGVGVLWRFQGLGEQGGWGFAVGGQGRPQGCCG